jgi:hypothetical protein
MTEAPERIKAWVWDLPYPSKHNGRPEWSSIMFPAEQKATDYIRADIAAAMVAAEREACAALVEHIVAEAKKSMTPAQILLSRDEPKAVADALTAIAAAIRNRGKL